MANARLQQLAARGQSIWIDLLSRELVHSGELRKMVDELSVTGLTSNPSIFQKAIAGGGDYDDQIRELLNETDDPREIFIALAIEDVRAACDVLRPVWEGTNGLDGFVSLEVDPNLAFDTGGTFEQAVDLHDRVDRENLYIKIPATAPGLPAIENCIAGGIPINITLIFSIDRYDDVVAAYQRGLGRLHLDGGDVSKVTSVASFFVSRLDTEADARLERLGNTELQGKLGIANAKLAYKHFEEAFAGRSGTGWPRPARTCSGRSGPRRRPRARRTAT